jgi:hypothetical protein
MHLYWEEFYFHTVPSQGCGGSLELQDLNCVHRTSRSLEARLYCNGLLDHRP